MSNVNLRRSSQSPTATIVEVGPITLAFSYETVVAFAVNHEWTVSENVWSKTTGRHINQLVPGGREHKRVTHEDFERRLNEVLDSIAVATR